MKSVLLALLWAGVVAAKKAKKEEPAPVVEETWLIGSGIAATIILAHTLLCKARMTILWRGPGGKAEKLGFPNWMGAKAQLEKIPLYQIMCAVQLNEAEYAGPFIAALGILAIKGIEAPIASSLAVFGQVAYYWPRIYMASEKNFNNGFPFYVPGALARYAAMGMITFEMYKVFSK